MEKELALVYMVAGVSSRFGGKIKQFAKVGPEGETLIEYSLKQALPAGFTKIVFIVGNKTEQPFRETFGNSYKGIPIEYCLQSYNPEERDKPLGTADALCCAGDSISSPFIICNGDDLYGENTFKILVKHLNNKNTCATIGYKLGEVLSEKGSVNRGMFKAENNRVLSIQETFNITKENLISKGLAEEDLSSQNIFILFPEVVTYLKETVSKFKEENKDNRKAECLLPEELNKLIQQNKISIEIYSTPDSWLGVTNPDDEEIVRRKLAGI